MYIDPTLRKKAFASVAVGAFFVLCVMIGYIGDYRHFYEMTFLSNFLTGALLMAAAVKIVVTGRDIPHFLYLDATALLLTVVIVCAVYAPQETFLAPTVVLHLVDPIVMLVFYLSACDAHESGYGAAVTSVVFPSLYYLFMIVFGKVTHHCVYKYFDTNLMTPTRLAVVALIALAIVIGLSVALLFINRLIRNAVRLRRGETARRGHVGL